MIGNLACSLQTSWYLLLPCTAALLPPLLLIGVVRESTKLLPMIDNVLTMIGWNDLKEFLNFVMGIVDLVKNQLLNTLDIIISIVDKIVNALQHIQ